MYYILSLQESLGFEEIYMIETLRAKSLVTLDDSGWNFLLQDFDFKTRQLKVVEILLSIQTATSVKVCII